MDVVSIPAPEKHPNADTLSTIRLLGGYTIVIRTEDWREGQLAAYVEPDYEVPTDRPEFAFLAREGRSHHRVAVKKLRGIYSMGLLIPAPPGTAEGDNVIEALGIRRYEPPPPKEFTGQIAGAQAAPPPAGFRPVYDVEAWRRYGHLFTPGEPVVVTEKLDGANARFTFQDGALHVGSRTEWKREESRLAWWRAVEVHPWIREWCEAHPGLTLYGEIFGNVGRLKYPVESIAFCAFDVLEGSSWWSWSALETLSQPYRAPVLYVGPYDAAAIEALGDGPSAIGAPYREGVVVRPVVERTHPELGRVQLKVVSNRYLEKATA